MFKQGQLNKIENVAVLKKVVDKLDGVFDARDLYHHSSCGDEVCKLSYFYDGRKEGFSISFMGSDIYSEPLDNYYDDTFGVVDFDNFDEIYQKCYDSILRKYEWGLTILNWSDVPQSDKDDIENILSKTRIGFDF